MYVTFFRGGLGLGLFECKKLERNTGGRRSREGVSEALSYAFQLRLLKHPPPNADHKCLLSKESLVQMHHRGHHAPSCGDVQNCACACVYRAWGDVTLGCAFSSKF